MKPASLTVPYLTPSGVYSECLMFGNVVKIEKGAYDGGSSNFAVLTFDTGQKIETCWKYDQADLFHRVTHISDHGYVSTEKPTLEQSLAAVIAGGMLGKLKSDGSGFFDTEKIASVAIDTAREIMLQTQ